MAQVGDVVEEWLHDIDKRGVSNAPPQRGVYCCAAAAMLVALLDHAERSQEAECLVPKGRLIESAGDICEQQFRPLQDQLDSAKSGAKFWCTAFQQMTTLRALGLVKQHARKKLCTSGLAFGLTEEGRVLATELRQGGEAREAAPLRLARRPVDTERGVVMLLVDEREGGGQR